MNKMKCDNDLFRDLSGNSTNNQTVTVKIKI